jgi:hypothetical protein
MYSAHVTLHQPSQSRLQRPRRRDSLALLRLRNPRALQPSRDFSDLPLPLRPMPPQRHNRQQRRRHPACLPYLSPQRSAHLGKPLVEPCLERSFFPCCQTLAVSCLEAAGEQG